MSAKITEILCPKCKRERLIILSGGDRNVLRCPDIHCGYQSAMR